jgi:multidrug resistance efflux pump
MLIALTYLMLLGPVTASSMTANAISASELPLMLTGTLQSEHRQSIVAPLSDSWQIQVQWLKPEQEIVQEGDLVAVFNAGNSKANIEQLKNQLISVNEQYKQMESENALLVMEAEFELKRNQLLLEKAGIDAAVPLENLSRYDYEKYQLELSRARTLAEKAAETLAIARITQSTVLKKQQLQQQATTAELAEAELQLGKMSIYAQRTGSINYGLHPWFRTKLFAGVTAQPGWLIAEVVEQQGLFIESWVHEMDISRLKAAKTLTARFDVAPNQTFTVQLTELAPQGEKRQSWGTGMYFKARFKTQHLPVNDALLGMGLLIEAAL